LLPEFFPVERSLTRLEMTMKHEYDVGTRTHRWTFGHGIADITFTVPGTDHPTYATAAIHGYKQKIADAGAIVRDTKTGKSATDAEKRVAMQSIVDRILNDELWNAERGGERVRKVPPINVAALVAAIVAIRQRPLEAVQAFVEAKTEETRFAMAMGDEFRLQYAMECTRLVIAKPLDATTAEELDNL
jgi:hypothetical protein